MITLFSLSVANRRRKWRISSLRNGSSDAAPKFLLSAVGLFVALATLCNNNSNRAFIFVVDAMAPPYPKLLEESRKHRELHESLLPNSTYFSLPRLPRGIWEPAADFKKRRKLHMSHINDTDPGDHVDDDELCRYLDHDECEDIFESFRRMGAKTRANIAGRSNGVSLSVGLRTASAESGSIQDTEPYTLRTLVILILWTDQEDRRDWITRDQVDHLWNGAGADDVIPTGSIKNFTERQSYGTVNFVADVIDWQLADNTEAYYADGRSAMPQNGDREPHLRTALQFVLSKMDDDDFPWEDYDSDNDGIIDHVQFLHSGYGAEAGGKDCYTDAPTQERIWAHALPEGRGKWTSKTGKEIGGFSITSAFNDNCDKNVAQIGITLHEFYHTLGLPDLYDKDRPYLGIRSGLGGLGVFCMMACPFGANNNQMYPGSLSPWSKLNVGFLKQPIEITESGTYEARPSNDYPDIYSIKSGYTDEEMLLLENRQPTGYDASLWTGGILIYKIDETRNHNGNHKHGFPGQIDAPESGQSWPSNGLHFPIALLQADGNYDLELARNNGDAGDFFNEPNQILGPGNGELVATDEGTYPNTDSYALGDIKTTGITIDNFRENPEGSGVFTFRVTFADEPVQLLPTTPPSNLPSNLVTEAPTENLTNKPSRAPTNTPSDEPTGPLTKPATDLPTKPLTMAPTMVQTTMPTNQLSKSTTNPSAAQPTTDPSKHPTQSPTQVQTKSPSTVPTDLPTTAVPIESPTNELVPIEEPTIAPTTQVQNKSPSTVPTDLPTTAVPTESPTTELVPTEEPTIAPTKARATLAPFDASKCSHIVQVSITTDDHPEETTWEIVSATTGQFLTGYRSSEDLRPQRSLQTYTEYNWKICASGQETSFLFRLYDKGLNGIQPPGKYSLSLDGELIEDGGSFTGASTIVKFSTATTT